MDDDRRDQPPRTAGDRESLVAFLDYQRQTLAWKCEGLTEEQLREKAVPPSGLSLLGLVRHAAEVERSWFQAAWSGEKAEAHWPGMVNGTYAEFDATQASAEEAFEVWRAACARSRSIVEAEPSLDTTVGFEGEVFSLRYVLLHMIEEYARHNGHADLLRERIDGMTGE
ncbi:DinB family protein [Cryptosporangium aurantiacum]|uniref:DinB family protein n=1 Tax=Cryptosporangium aurantiacum TaxID=134849 RepID=UPI0009348078|nr:DinB family protein [Cryptosporangium aurantiacum]